jgi:hypothetical protein
MYGGFESRLPYARSRIGSGSGSTISAGTPKLHNAVDGVATAAGTVAAMEGVLAGVMVELSAAVVANTVALYATGFIPGLQAGGTVLRTGVALVHEGETVAGKSLMRGIGEGLTATSGVNAPVNVTLTGNTFHGVPDQRYVQSIFNNAVTQLRNSSRSWAFNPKGQ